MVMSELDCASSGRGLPICIILSYGGGVSFIGLPGLAVTLFTEATLNFIVNGGDGKPELSCNRGIRSTLLTELFNIEAIRPGHAAVFFLLLRLHFQNLLFLKVHNQK